MTRRRRPRSRRRRSTGSPSRPFSPRRRGRAHRDGQGAVAPRVRAVYAASLVVAVVGLVTAGAFLFWQWQTSTGPTAPYLTMREMVAVDGFSVFLGTVVLVATLLACCSRASTSTASGIEVAEYLALLLFSAAGMLVMTTANDLIVGVRGARGPVDPALRARRVRPEPAGSLEAGMKYFVLGAFSSAIFLYGIALVYGATGTTSLTGIDDFLSRQHAASTNGTLLAGIMLLLVGLGFKVAAVPFHMWTPDVYQGSPTPVTGFMASATKAAGFAALLRVFVTAFVALPRPTGGRRLGARRPDAGSAASSRWSRPTSSGCSPTRRSPRGYVLIGVEAGDRQGAAPRSSTCFVYTFMTIGTFAVVTVAEPPGDDGHEIDDYRGLAARQPVLGGPARVLPARPGGHPADRWLHRQAGVFSAAADARRLLAGARSACWRRWSPRSSTCGSSSRCTRPRRRRGAPSRRSVAGSTSAPRSCSPSTAGVTIVLGVVPAVFLDCAPDATLLVFTPAARQPSSTATALALTPIAARGRRGGPGARRQRAGGRRRRRRRPRRRRGPGRRARRPRGRISSPRERSKTSRSTGGARQLDDLDRRRARSAAPPGSAACGAMAKAWSKGVEGWRSGRDRQSPRHVEHVDPVVGPGEGVRDRHVVHHGAVDEAAAVVADRAGSSPGSAVLASSAGASGPAANTASSPVARSVATTRSGTLRSWNDRGRRRSARRGARGPGWAPGGSSLAHRRARSGPRRPPGKSSSARSGSQIRRAGGRPRGSGRRRRRAVQRADRASRSSTSGTIRCSRSARSIPTCATRRGCRRPRGRRPCAATGGRGAAAAC